jgi:iron complex outermembrane receptor protein
LNSFIRLGSRFFFVCALFSQLVLAEGYGIDDEYQAEDDFFGESPVVLTVARMSKPLQNSPVSVSIIDRQMIRDSGAREIADIFRMVPGFVVGYHFGHSPGVTYQGLGSNWQRNLQVFIDGRSVFIPSFGGIPWSNLPLLLEDIERVEISRGPNAVTYGANAFLATINIITRHAAEDYGSLVSLTTGVDKDSNVRDFYFRTGDQQGDLDWRLTAGLVSDDGFKNDNDSKQMHILNLRSDFLTAYNQFWTVQLGINRSVFDRGDGDASDIFREEHSSNSYQNIKWELIEDKVNTTALLTHTRQNSDDSFISDRLNAGLDELFNLDPPVLDTFPQDITLNLDFDRTSDRIDAELFQSRELSSSVTLVYGASLRRDEVKSIFLFHDNEHHEVNTRRLFSSFEWEYTPDLLLDAGLMYEDNDMVEHKFSGRLSAIQKIGQQHSLRLVASSAHRNPIIAEQSADIEATIELPAIPGLPQQVRIINKLGNPQLQPETIVSTEIGLFSEYLERQLTTDLRLFQYRIYDQIIERENDTFIVDPATGIPIPQHYRSPENSAESNVKGLEFTFNYSPQHKDFRLYGGFSRVWADATDIHYQNSFPDATAYVGGHINISENQQLSTGLYHVGSMSWADTSNQLDAHNKLDLRYQITLEKKHNTRLELIGYNLVDRKAEYINRNKQQQTLLLRISSRF